MWHALWTWLERTARTVRLRCPDRPMPPPVGGIDRRDDRADVELPRPGTFSASCFSLRRRRRVDIDSAARYRKRSNAVELNAIHFRRQRSDRASYRGRSAARTAIRLCRPRPATRRCGAWGNSLRVFVGHGFSSPQLTSQGGLCPPNVDYVADGVERPVMTVSERGIQGNITLHFISGSRQKLTTGHWWAEPTLLPTFYSRQSPACFCMGVGAEVTQADQRLAAGVFDHRRPPSRSLVAVMKTPRPHGSSPKWIITGVCIASAPMLAACPGP